MPFRFLFIILFASSSLTAQTSFTANHERISNSLTDYFMMNRENIYIHLNKSVYLDYEQIWFKGYVTEKKTKAPFYETTNVYVSLIDENGINIQTILCYAENSIFQGNIKLNKTLKSGKYFLRVFTNYMNNFSEDESSIFEITILNTNQVDYNLNTIPNFDAVEVSFFPESGNFITGTSNNIGVQAIDCNGNGIELKNGEILDENNNIVTTFSTNKLGYGKFEIRETEAKQYKSSYSINNQRLEKKLPLPTGVGITFSVDNYTFPNKTTIKVKTNKKSLDLLDKGPYTLVIQQNQEALFLDFTLKDNQTEELFSLPSEKLFEGINTIHLVDSKLTKIGERNIYKADSNISSLSMNIYEKRSDSIVISGTSKIPLANMSISVLAAECASNLSQKSIQSAQMIDSYLINNTNEFSYYTDGFNRKKQYELDSYLLSQKSKYDWNNMLLNNPKEIFEFDRGISIKGTINSDVKDPETYKINMTALGLGINASSQLNSKKEFVFEHVIAIDSTKLYFVILDKKGEKSPVKTYCQVLNNNRKFTKPLLQNSKKCPVTESNNPSEKRIFPKIEGAVALDSIVINAKKNKLVHENKNRFASGYKITDKDAVRYRDLLHFINNNGFTVSTLKGNVAINGYSFGASAGGLEQNASIRRASTAILTGREVSGPIVFIDDVYIQDYNTLRDYGLETIDEIYISREHRDVSYFKSKGIIKIYSKKTTQISNVLKDKSPSLLIKNGFQNINSFENVKYNGVKDAGFNTYGTIDWKQNIFTDQEGNFKFSIPNLYQNKVKIVIEGINNDGQLISASQIIDVPN